jgi:hypothetical protein
VTATATVTATAAPSAPTAGAAAATAAYEPALVGADGKPLPQTEGEPSLDSPLFRHHMALLLRAIVEDDPTIAEAVFFPKLAYEQVKAIEKPGLDWKNRLWKLFARDVHEYHKKLGQEPAAARLVRVEPGTAPEWMKPGREGNKLGYFRSKRMRLVVAGGDGKEIAFEITSCISWRGEWYVVHLHGFE